MKVVTALDSCRESLSALEVVTAIGLGFREIWPDMDYAKIPVAGGGEGTVEAMVAATQGRLVHVDVTGLLGNTIQALYGLSDDKRSVFIGMAVASGLEQAPAGLRDPLKMTSWGTRELIRYMLDAGVEHIVIGIGDSATNNDGTGMVQALGAKSLDVQNNEIARGGIGLESLPRIDISQLDSRLAGCRIGVACDVTNLLTGEESASTVSSPQKGATPEMITRLDRVLIYYAQLIARDLNVNVLDLAGGGATDGMGAALYASCGAQLCCGIEMVTDTLHLDTCAVGVDLVVTDGGCIDSRTIHGKVPVGVTKAAKRYNRPVIGTVGSLAAGVGMVYEHGLDAAFSVIYSICILDEVLKNVSDNVRMTARNVAVTPRAGQQLY